MPVSEQQINDLHERQDKLELTVGRVAANLEQVVESNKQQAEAIIGLTSTAARNQEAIRAIGEGISNMAHIQDKQWDHINKMGKFADESRAKEGRVSIGQMLTWLVPTCGFIAVLAAMYIAPLQQEQLHQGAKIQELYDEGSPKMRQRIAVIESTLNEDHERAMRQLEREAAAWRNHQHNAQEERPVP